MTETVLEKVGKSERTTDEEFDIHVEKFRRMVGDINECQLFSLPVTICLIRDLYCRFTWCRNGMLCW